MAYAKQRHYQEASYCRCDVGGDAAIRHRKRSENSRERPWERKESRENECWKRGKRRQPEWKWRCRFGRNNCRDRNVPSTPQIRCGLCELHAIGTYQLARLGNMQNICARADYLKGLDPRYGPFPGSCETWRKAINPRPSPPWWSDIARDMKRCEPRIHRCDRAGLCACACRRRTHLHIRGESALAPLRRRFFKCLGFLQHFRPALVTATRFSPPTAGISGSDFLKSS